MNVASRIQEIEGHIGDIYDTLELGGDTTQNKNIVNINSEIKREYKDFLANGTDTLWNNWNKVSGTGESLTLNNTIKAKMEIDLNGNTQQNGTPTPDSPVDIQSVTGNQVISVCGKNLFDGVVALGEFNNLGNINSTSIRNYSVNYIPVTPSTNYVSNLTINRMCFYDKNKNFISRSSNFSFTTFTTLSNAYYIRFDISTDYDTDTMQIEQGSTATSYEAYQSQTYPIYLGVENLLENNATTQTISGVSFIKNSDGTITANGTATAQILYVINSSVSMTGNYTLSGSPTTSQDSTYFLQLYGTGGVNDYGNGASISNFNGVIRIVVRNGAVLNDVIFKPQIEKGTKKSPYTPYGTTPIELCWIPNTNYRDRLFKAIDGDSFYDTLDTTTKNSLDSGSWYKYGAIGKVVLDGSETWVYDTVGGFNRFSTLLQDAFVGTGRQICLSNYFINNLTSNADGICFIVNKYVYLYKNDTTNANDFKTWLSTHNTEVYYVLSTPTYTKITDTNLISDLNNLYNLKSYNDTTNISVDGDLPMILDVSALIND